MTRTHASRAATADAESMAKHAQPMLNPALADQSAAVLALQRDQQMVDSSPAALQMKQRALMLATNPASEALSRYQKMATGATRPVAQRQVVQRFSDSVNDKRRNDAAEETGVDMQLDHAVSQDTLKKFNEILPLLRSIPEELRPQSVMDFTEKARELFDDQKVSPDGNPFLNLRNNLTPGFKNTLQDPGNLFAAQIEVDGADVIVSEQAKHLEMLDRGMRWIFRKSEIVKLLGRLDPDSTEDFRAELDSDFQMLNTALDFLNTSGEQPGYEADQWYDYKDKKVKKVAATYLEGTDGLLNTLGSKKSRSYTPKRITKFVNINTYKESSGKRKALVTKAVPLTVTVTVPDATWRHIYERHTIDYFAWDVQAINTFWKTDPQLIFDENEDAIVAELLLIIDRQMDLEHEIAEAKRGEGATVEEENVINESGSLFFFQGTYSFEEMSTYVEGREQFEKDELAIVLKSFAPQSANLAYAVLPSVLTAKKPGSV